MRSILVPILAALAASSAAAQAQQPTRGALLYANHCVECHNVQMHWRANSRARDWQTLKGQVYRWQAEARLQWSEDDVVAVTRHLNDTIYRFPQPQAALAR